MRTARPATASAVRPSMEPELAKPHAPSTRTRILKPSVSPRLSHLAALEPGALLLLLHHTHVGIAGAEVGGRVERAMRQVVHG